MGCFPQLLWHHNIGNTFMVLPIGYQHFDLIDLIDMNDWYCSIRISEYLSHLNLYQNVIFDGFLI